MSNISFMEKVKNYFDYLEFEYEFKIFQEHKSDIRPQTDGMVEYRSNTTGIIIDSENGSTAIRFYRLMDGKKYYLTPIDVFEYINTNDNEKKLLLSTKPADRSSASALSNEKFLLNQPSWKGNQGGVEDIDKELMNFSNWLRAHADLCIKGDFSKWPDFYEYKIHRARADLLRRGKNELVYHLIKDANGNSKLIKQSAFKDEMEYIEKLKREFS